MSMTEGDVNELVNSAPLLSEELDFSTKGCEKCLPPITQEVLDNEQCSLLKVAISQTGNQYFAAVCQKVSKSIIWLGFWLKKSFQR